MLRVKLTISLTMTTSATYKEGDQKYQHHGPVQIILKIYQVKMLFLTT